MLIKNKMNPDWYKNIAVLWELCNQLKYKYLSIRKTIKQKETAGKTVVIKKFLMTRYLLGRNPETLVKSVEKFGGFENIKLYFDLTCWKDMPMFSFDEAKRQQERKQFNDNWKNHFNGYDYAIDLDAKDLSKSYETAKVLKDYLDQIKVPYSVKFSGSKGFHFYIPFSYLPKSIKPINLPKRCSKTTEWLINRLNLKCVDESIYDHRRVLKLAYSLDNENVALPLDDFQFSSFKIENMKTENVLRTVKIFRRGLLIRDHNLTEEQLIRNTKKLFQLKEV